jgi:purine catabolism regulator
VRDASLTAFELGARTRTVDLERLATRWLDELGVEHVFAAEGGRVRGFVPEDMTGDLAERAGTARPVGGGLVHLGLGSPSQVDALGRSATQARQALDSALDDGRRVVRFAELPTVAFVLDALGAEEARQLSGVLDGLRDLSGEHGELTEALHIFLSEHGGHRASAARLGIHRQTLASRVRRAEELTGLSMDRPDDRAAAWLALRALGR